MTNPSAPEPLPEPTPATPEAGRVVSFADGAEALRAARALLDVGLPATGMGLVGLDEGAMAAGLAAIGFPVQPHHEDPVQLAHDVARANHDVIAGAAMGAATGLAVAFGPVLVPVLGPWLLAGAAAELIGGAALTAAVGGGIGAVFGALFELDGEHRHLERWEANMRTGGWLLTLRGTQAEMWLADQVLVNHPVDHVDHLAIGSP